MQMSAVLIVLMRVMGLQSGCKLGRARLAMCRVCAVSVIMMAVMTVMVVVIVMILLSQMMTLTGKRGIAFYRCR